VGVPNLTLKNDNVGKQKEYAYVYKDVLEAIHIDKDMLDFYYKSNASMRHFYEDKQIEKFNNKWMRA
jgi:hypothetical protein